MIKFIKSLCLCLAFCSSVVLANELIEAVKKEDLVKVKELLNQGLDVNEKDTNGDTSIIIAAKKRNPELIKLLLDYGAKSNNLSNLAWNSEQKERLYKYHGMKNIKVEPSKNPEFFRSMNLLRLDSYLLNNKSIPISKYIVFGNNTPCLNDLSQEDLFWFFDRAIKQNKERLLTGEYGFIVKLYKDIKQDYNLINLLSALTFICKNKINKKHSKTKDKIYISYENLADIVIKIIWLHKVSTSISETTVSLLKDKYKLSSSKKATNFMLNAIAKDSMVLPLDLSKKIALEY